MLMKKNILVGVTTVALVFSTGAVAFAATDTTGSSETQARQCRSTVMSGLTDDQKEAVQQVRAAAVKDALAELVEKGEIAQDAADKLSEFGKAPKDKASLKDQGPFSSLTDAQRTALREEEQSVFESKIDELVNDGTLTQNLADQMDQGHKMLPFSNLTDTQKKAVMEAGSASMKAAVANLVEKGTITQEEADTLTALPKEMSHEKGEFNVLTEAQQSELTEIVKSKLESGLADLVSDGTITSDQADQLLNENPGLHMGPGGKSGFHENHKFGGRTDSKAQSTDDQSTEVQSAEE